MQNFEVKNQKIDEAFDTLKNEHPEKIQKQRLKLSWSNWGFGVEKLEVSARRLAASGLSYIELHGNHYGNDLGYDAKETLAILNDYGIRVAGLCGMFSSENDFSSKSGVQRQAAIDYIRRELDFASEVGAGYILVVPGAVGRSTKYDDSEFHRSVETLQIVADDFVKHNVKAAIEPIRSAEVSFCHTVAEAQAYIAAVNHSGVQHINGDVYHMLVEESHIPESILVAGEALTNLHLADTNRCALGAGFLDLDRIIKALYLLGYNNDTCFCTPEPLGPGGDPYPAMFGKSNPLKLDALVAESISYFRAREQELIS